MLGSKVLTTFLTLLTLKWCHGFDIYYKESEANQKIEGIVSNNSQHVYRFTVPELHTNDSSIRVEFSSSMNSSERCPVHFVVRQRKEVQTIGLPQGHEASNLSLYTGGRTLCLRPEEWTSSIFVTVSTCNLDLITYSFVLFVQQGYIIRLNELKVVDNVGATSPVFYRFAFPDNAQFVRVNANSTKISKTIVSIQKPDCPVRDELTNIKHSGHYRTMSQNMTLIVQKVNYPDGFILVFLPDPRTTPEVSAADSSHSETISFYIEGPPDWSEIVRPSLWVPLALYCIGILLVYILFSCCHHQYVGNGQSGWTPNFLNRLCPGNYDTDLRVQFFTAESNMYQYLKANSYRYIWTTLTIVFFYGLPVMLLSLTLTRFSKETGDLDICHFNYRCSYPFWIFVSFNHVYSCLGFVLLGLTFMALTHVRATKLVVHETDGGAMRGEAEDPGRWGCCHFRTIHLRRTLYGAYQNFGAFYTMGFTLMFVGIMKMAYNTCPSKDTTFFGLTFMFIIVLLCQIKIYNLRHPCMVTDNFTFMCIGMVMVAISAAYVITDYGFQVAISVFISFWIQIAILILHSAGRVSEKTTLASSDGENAPLTVLVTSPTALFYNVFCAGNLRPLFTPEWRRRTFWTVLRLFLNVGILSFIWTQMTQNHFTTRMYVLVLANFLLDFIAYYIVHKGLYKEYTKLTSWQPLVYLVFAITFWMLSLVALTASLSAWELPTIFLQERFMPCKFGFYDDLDMYHWLAAPAWFFTFMVMLTADDELSRTMTKMTAVF